MSLSDRIRPDCEASPWVIKEVKEMESRIEFWIEKSTMQAIQISGMETEIQILKAENARYRKALEFYAEPWERGTYDGDLVVRKIGSYDAFEEVHHRAREALKEIE